MESSELLLKSKNKIPSHGIHIILYMDLDTFLPAIIIYTTYTQI